MNLPRYTLTCPGSMVGDPSGEWVKASDAQALVSAINTLLDLRFGGSDIAGILACTSVGKSLLDGIISAKHESPTPTK